MTYQKFYKIKNPNDVSGFIGLSVSSTSLTYEKNEKVNDKEYLQEYKYIYFK
jgi:hypothetical protein